MPHSSRRTRQGTAAVEFAVCFPVVAFIITAGMDVTQVVRTNQAVVEATHEIARVVATNDIDEQQCQQFADGVFENKKLLGATVSFAPIPTSTMPRGTDITITVSVPIDANCTVITYLFTSRTLDSHAMVSREIGQLNVASN